MRARPIGLVLVIVSALSSNVSLIAGAASYEYFRLKFKPEETTTSIRVPLPGQMTRRPVRLVLSDSRVVQHPLVIGAHVRGEKNLQMRSSDPVLATVSGFIGQILRGWLILPSDDARFHLQLELANYSVQEAEDFWSSTYVGEVAFRAALRGSANRELWNGTAHGVSRHVGFPGNIDNCNLVLSDALNSALADLLQQKSLQDAWSRDDATDDSSSKAVSPDRLLEDLERLKEAGVGIEVLTGLAGQTTLNVQLSADDILKWKARGIPEAVIAVVLRKQAPGPPEN